MSEPAAADQTDELQADADAVIAACGGDAVAAVKSLLVVNGELQSQIERLTAAGSAGFARGGMRKRPTQKS